MSATMRLRRWGFCAAAGVLLLAGPAPAFYWKGWPSAQQTIERTLISPKDFDTPGNPPGSNPKPPPDEQPPSLLPPIDLPPGPGPGPSPVPEPGTGLLGLLALAGAAAARRRMRSNPGERGQEPTVVFPGEPGT